MVRPQNYPLAASVVGADGISADVDQPRDACASAIIPAPARSAARRCCASAITMAMCSSITKSWSGISRASARRFITRSTSSSRSVRRACGSGRSNVRGRRMRISACARRRRCFSTLPMLLIASAIAAGIVGFAALHRADLDLRHRAGVRRRRARRSERIHPGLDLSLCAALGFRAQSISTYWAVYWYLRHGGYPFGDKLLTKGIGRDWVEGGRVAAETAAQQSKR